MPEYKNCTICKADKTIDLFAIDKRNKSGFAATCKQCDSNRKDRAKARVSNKKQYIKFKIKKLAAGKVWRDNNKSRMKYLVQRWSKNNPGVLAARCRKYQATKLKATPAWANDFFIEEIYDLAKLREKHTGTKWHVDHIVPLKSTLVCGLHVEYNMQVIPARDNLSKGNRFWPDMP